LERLLRLPWRAIPVTVAVAIMVVIIPIALGAPAMAVFIPPTMTVFPTILAGLAQLGARVVGLLALASMMFDCFVKAMVRFRNAPLAIIPIGAQSRPAGEEQKSRQCRPGQRYFTRAKNPRLKSYLHPVLLFLISDLKAGLKKNVAPAATSRHTESSAMIRGNSCILKSKILKSSQVGV
jgi:hypothetical protein